MNIIQKLRLKCFEGFLDSDHIVFTPGLNLIRGRNSAGKTSLLEGILYGLYGKISDVNDRLLVSRRSGESLEVYLKFRNPHSKKDVEVHRKGELYTRKGKEYFRTLGQQVLLEGKEQPLNTQEEIRQFVHEQLGLGIKRFTNLVYVRQGQLNRILEPSREDMDLILGITLIRELKEQLNQTKKEMERYEGFDVVTQTQQLEDTTIPDLEGRLTRLEEEISDRKEDEKQLRELIEKAESPELQSLLNSIKERDDYQLRINQAIQQVKTLLERNEATTLDALRETVKKRNESLEQLRREAESKREAADDLNTKIVSYTTITKRLKEEAGRHQKLIEEGKEKCPVCGQRVTVQTIQALIHEKREEAKQHERKTGEFSTAYGEVKEEADKLTRRSHQLESQIKQIEKDGKQVEGLTKQVEKHHQILEQVFVKIEVGLKELQLPFEKKDPDLKARVAERLPLDPETLEEKRNQHKKLEAKLKEYEGEEKQLRKSLNESKRLLTILKQRGRQADVAGKVADRLELVMEERRRMILKRLENQVLRIYNQLTDQHLYQAISIDKDTYKVFVHPTGAKGKIPAARTGGGHQTLLSLALRLAILREGRHTSLLILDEPTYGVDRENLPQLMSHISEAAKQVSQVLLVTHHGFGEEEATNIINVELNEDGYSEIIT